jgi:hypothetical protein
VFFPIYLNTFHGIRNVDPQLIEMGRTYGLTRWQLYREVILPGALSSILVGLRFSLGLMWVILIVAETISAQAGIGYLTMNAREFLQTDIVLVGILLYALLGKLADLFARGWSNGGCVGIRATSASAKLRAGHIRRPQHPHFSRRTAVGALALRLGAGASSRRPSRAAVTCASATRSHPR